MREPIGIRRTVGEDYPDHLHDESRWQGRAGSISFPCDENELRAHLQWAAEQRLPVTIQGGRTGIAGGAVPEGGHVLSLWRMRRYLGLRRHPDGKAWLLRVQPGVLLSELRDALRERALDTAGWDAASRAAFAVFEREGRYFFPPDLTESGAALGGLAANNGSGARTFAYGAARASIQAARVFLADGDVLDLARGEQRAVGRRFDLVTAAGRRLAGKLPTYRMPAVKNAAGYFVQDDMDLLDLFIGSEGTLGVIASLELKLIPTPAAMWGVTVFLPNEAAALTLVEQARTAAPQPAAIEFFDAHVLDLLRAQKDSTPAFASIPALAEAWHTAVYVEYHAASEAAAEAAVMALSESIVACGGDPDATWLATGESEIDRFKAFRHAAPECVNLLIDQRRKREPQLTKLGTDLAVPDDRLREVMAMYRADLAASGLEYAIFGHIGNNHVHVNIIPHTLDEYRRGKDLYLGWAARVVTMGGTVSAEHGIGKLKRELLRIMYGDAAIEQMRELKRLFDPGWRLGCGNLFAI
jgi:D-lactate dehydrogenase (cytochrome)